MSPEQLKHMDFIQAIITRMNANSFQIKGWAVTITSALMAIYASSKNCGFLVAAMFPAVAFWLLDASYLQRERKFRGLYDDVAGISDAPRQLKVFEMRPDLYVGSKYSFWKAFTSVTLLKVYLSIIVILVALFFWCF